MQWEKLKLEAEQAALRDCTFAPKTNAQRLANYVPIQERLGELQRAKRQAWASAVGASVEPFWNIPVEAIAGRWGQQQARRQACDLIVQRVPVLEDFEESACAEMHACPQRWSCCGQPGNSVAVLACSLSDSRS